MYFCLKKWKGEKISYDHIKCTLLYWRLESSSDQVVVYSMRKENEDHGYHNGTSHAYVFQEKLNMI